METARRCPQPECTNSILYSFGTNLYFCEDHGPKEPVPEGICVERGGQCALGENCRCKREDTTEGGW